MKILVDTNVLVRSVERAHPLLPIARHALRRLYERGDELYDMSRRKTSANSGMSVRVLLKTEALATVLKQPTG